MVSNETDGKETDSGYSVYLLRGQFYEEYVKQTAAGHPMGSVVSNDNQVIELDGKQYVGQLFSGGFMYIDGGNLVVDTEHYYDTETKQPVRGGIENYVVAPSWFESQTLTGHFVDKEDENIHYFNFGDTCVAVGTVNGDQYEYEYFARRIYNESTNELEIVRYERDELIYMGRQSVLWNGEASLNAIKNAYPQMDQNTTLEQFEKDVQDAMWAAYNRYIDQGFSLGRSSGEGIMLWGNAIKLGFQGTDSDGEYIDNYEKCFLLYNPIQKYAYAFYGPPISACYGLNNTGGVDNITQMGAPIDEMQYISEGIYADSWYQNFTTGYIFVEKSFPDTVQFVEGGVFDGTVPVDEEKNAEALLQKEEREKAQSGGCGGTLGSLGSLLALAPVAAAVGFIRNRKGGV